jgi:hypothetical protein
MATHRAVAETGVRSHRKAPDIAVGCHEGLWLLDHADAKAYYTARVWAALAAVLSALALWWMLA